MRANLMILGWLAVPMLLLAAGDAAAQGYPGSVLVFPLVDSTDGHQTLISVTNTNSNQSICSDGYAGGDVVLIYRYVNGESCGYSGLYEFLAPGETRTVLVKRHFPEFTKGYLVVTALAPDSPHYMLNFDYLVGRAVVLGPDRETAYSYNATPFRALWADSNDCWREEADHNNNGKMDFDEVEYDGMPESIFAPSFMEEVKFDSRLVLMSTVRSGPAAVNITIRNNQGDTFSKSITLYCWRSGTLSQLLGPVAANLGGDSTELPFNVETGSFEMTSSKPILAVLMQRSANGDFEYGDTLVWSSDRKDGDEFP
jgi:hypothetical protein